MVRAVLSGPLDTRDALVNALRCAGGVIDYEPDELTGGFPPAGLEWITVTGELHTIDSLAEPFGWELRLHTNAAALPMPVFSYN